MTELWVSVGVLAGVVLVCEATRRVAARALPAAGRLYLHEAVSTFQLCCCTHELKLLADTSRLDLSVGLSLTYAVTVVHLLSFRDASANPLAALERLCRGTSGAAAAAGVTALQFAAAGAARSAARSVWSLGLSDAHARHRRFGFRCFDPLGGTLLEAAAAELLCAFTVQAAGMSVRKVRGNLRVHALAAVITAVVWAGGSVSGAVFNPVLAFSVQFPCSGHTSLEYCFVYWLGPVLGVASCILLFERIVPFLWGGPDAPAGLKHKTE